MVLTTAPLLLKLRTKIMSKATNSEISKWASYTGLAYIFVVFWFNYCMLWAANMVPYDRASQVFGWAFLFEPVNFISFAATVFGLLAIGTAAYVVLRPVLKGKPNEVNLRMLGFVIVCFAGYFVFNTIYYVATGGYEAHPSVWYEVISPMHNANLWTMALLAIGIPLMTFRRIEEHPKNYIQS
jgi:hypothetical protein